MNGRSGHNHSMTNESESVDTTVVTRKILVGVDGSDPSIAALRWAAYEARRRSADVLAVSCYSAPVYGSPEGAVYPSHEDLDMFKQGPLHFLRSGRGHLHR